MTKTIIKKPDTSVTKALASDVKGYLRDAIQLGWIFEDGYVYGIDYDAEKGFVYFEVEYYNSGYYSIYYRLSYTLSGVTVTLGDTLDEVKKESSYTVVSEDTFIGKDLLNSIKHIVKELLPSKKEESIFKKNSNGYYIEKFQEEAMIAYEPLYTPPETADGVGDGMTEVEIEKMVVGIKDKIEKGIMQANLFHKVPTDSFKWVDAFVNPWPTCIVGDQEVIKGQPVAVAQYTNVEAWILRKSGKIKGPSIEGTAGNKVTVEGE